MAATHDGPFATDLRALSPDDRRAVRSATHQRIGSVEAELDALAAYDVVVHLPHVTPATPDRDALDHAPSEVEEPFSRWQSGSPLR